jgi:SAM-dependent methyltransferase
MERCTHIPASIARLKARLRNVPGYPIARFFYRLAQSTESRNASLLLLRPPHGLYQPYGTTFSNRYPGIFEYVRACVGDGPNTRILSLGCSTGEEVFSLRGYFPKATIVGIDINPINVAVCRFRRLRKGDKKSLFAVAASAAGQANASYDAIFAMALFRHGDLNIVPPPPHCNHRIRFADFEQSIADLARALKPGGLLAIQHAMFRFSDTKTADGFNTVLAVKVDEKVPLYNCNDCLIADAVYPDVVFQKSK